MLSGNTFKLIRTTFLRDAYIVDTEQKNSTVLSNKIYQTRRNIVHTGLNTALSTKAVQKKCKRTMPKGSLGNTQ